MDTTGELVNPIPRPRTGPFTVRTVPEGAQVVLFDNGKPNSMAILRRTQQLLRERGVDVKEDIRGKEFAGSPVDDQTLGMLAQERGLLLLGVHD